MPPPGRGVPTSGRAGRGGGRGAGGRGGRSSYEKLRGAGGGALAPQQQKAVRRAEAVGLPQHLCYGITFEGLKKAVSATAADGAPLDGYAYREVARRASKADGLSMCERLLKQGSADVGMATIFVSWHLGSSTRTLVAALENLIESTSCTRNTTCFWIRVRAARPHSSRRRRPYKSRRSRAVCASRATRSPARSPHLNPRRPRASCS
jgi:hypothetical protein